MANEARPRARREMPCTPETTRESVDLTLWMQLLQNMQIPPDEAFVFSRNGRSITLYAGCRVHECITKAYLATNADGRIVVAAIQTHIYCSRAVGGPCSNGRPIVDVTARDVDAPMLQALLDRIKTRCRATSIEGGACNIYMSQPS